MTIEAQNRLGIGLADAWLPWIALRHFLPASGVRELCRIIVNDTSGGSLSIGDIIEERLSGGDIFSETWIIRPKICSSILADYLIRYVQRMVWQNDTPMWSRDEGLEFKGAVSVTTLEFAFNLGSADLAHPLDQLEAHEYVQPGLKAMYEAVRLCSSRAAVAAPEVDNLINEVGVISTNVSLELRIAIFKHLGDLYCDRGSWLIAAKFYAKARELVSGITPVSTAPFIVTMRVALDQSLAAAAAVNFGYDAALSQLVQSLEERRHDSPVLALNLARDEFIARTRSGKTWSTPDTRTAMLVAPLISESHQLELALISWRDQDFETAITWFWASLRRQIALGQLSASKGTKAFFAECVVDQLRASKQYNIEMLRLAVGLLIESENSTCAKRIKWDDDLLDSTVDEDILKYIIDSSEAYPGSQKRRRAVTVILFSDWASHISADRKALARYMLHYLIQTGANLKTSPENDGADFNSFYSAVLQILQKRPEFRIDVCEEIADVLGQRIGNTGFWTGEDVALQLVAECSSDISSLRLKSVVQATISLLERYGPSQANWVIVKPAIRLFGTTGVAKFAQENVSFGQDIRRMLLKFADDPEGLYAADIISALNQYPSSDLYGVEETTKYKNTINQAVQRAAQINSSNSINNVMALLSSPKAAGKEAITKVLKILVTLLESGANEKASLIFGAAYHAIRYLVAYKSEIAKDADISEEEISEFLSEVGNIVQKIWNTAFTQPSIFAPFALLKREAASRDTVHNWVVASYELADAVGQTEAMHEKIENARLQPQLSEGISLGFATRHAGGGQANTDTVSMDNESRGAFYAAIGRRLTALQTGRDSIFATKLVLSTLRHGPKQVDAAVFAAISPDWIEISNALLSNLAEYQARIGENRELSLILMPLIHRWKSRGVELLKQRTKAL